MSDLGNDLPPEDEFMLLINLLMVKGITDGVDPDLMAYVCLDTARELYNHYGAGEKHTSYISFVKDAEFQMAEIENWLEEVEGKSWKDDDSN